MKRSREQAQAILLALKNGVVPPDPCSFGIGRQKELQELDQHLQLAASGNGTVKFIGGEYGAGKSFLLQTFQQNALSLNFVTAHIQIDKGLRLNDFQTIYYHIMHSLAANESGSRGTSFKDLFNGWIRRLQHAGDKEASSAAIGEVISDLNGFNISFSRALLYYLRARIQRDHELADAVASWLTGEKNIPYQLKKRFDIVGKIDKTNAVDFLQAFIRLIRWLGYQGLVVLIDELELIMNERSDIRQHAYINLRYLIDNCFNGHLKHSMFLFAATREWFHHPEKGPQTYLPLSQRLGRWPEGHLLANPEPHRPVMVLTGPAPVDFQALARKVVDLYRQAYEFELRISMESLQNWIRLLLREDGTPDHEINMRSYLMKLTEFLDLMRSHPDSRVFNAEIKAVSRGEKIQFIQTLNRSANVK